MGYTLYESDEAQIRDLLIGHSVRQTGPNELTLDNGTVLQVSGNEGCGGCSSGWYDVSALGEAPNAILSVDFTEGEKADGSRYPETVYSIFVYQEGIDPVALVEVTGDDGNGYYGTGYHIDVLVPTSTQ